MKIAGCERRQRSTAQADYLLRCRAAAQITGCGKSCAGARDRGCADSAADTNSGTAGNGLSSGAVTVNGRDAARALGRVEHKGRPGVVQVTAGRCRHSYVANSHHLLRGRCAAKITAGGKAHRKSRAVGVAKLWRQVPARNHRKRETACRRQTWHD